MKQRIKYGLLVMSMWIVFVIALIGGYASYHHVAVLDYVSDEELGLLPFSVFFVVSVIFFYSAGSHVRKAYEAMQQVYSDEYKEVEKEELKRLVRTYYFTKNAKRLSLYLIAAVPFWWFYDVIFCITPGPKDYVVTAVLVVLAIACFGYYRKNRAVLVE